jgi:hypothetical protein
MGVLLRIWIVDNLGQANKVNEITVENSVSNLLRKYDKASTPLSGQATAFGYQGAFLQHAMALHFMALTPTDPLQFHFSESDPSVISTYAIQPPCDQTDQNCLSNRFFSGPYDEDWYDPQSYVTWDIREAD